MKLASRHPWIFVVLAFGLLLGAWTSIIVLAVKHGPEKVPLEHVAQPPIPDNR